jgi:hypothetical protein
MLPAASGGLPPRSDGGPPQVLAQPGPAPTNAMPSRGGNQPSSSGSGLPHGAGGIGPMGSAAGLPPSNGGLPLNLRGAEAMGPPIGSTGSVPKLALDAPGVQPMPMQVAPVPELSDVQLGNECESEIDRLVRERLEGRFTDRVHAHSRMKGIATYHNTWAGRVDGSVREACWSVWEGINYGKNVLLGRANGAVKGAGAACSRVIKATPLVMGDDDEEDDWLDHNAPPPHILAKQDEEFKDLISTPAAASAPNQRSQVAPVGSSTQPPPMFSSPAPSSTSGQDQRQASAPRSGGMQDQKPVNDRGSALSMSSAMTSTAAQALGGLAQANVRPKGAGSDAAARPSDPAAGSSKDAYGAQGGAPSAQAGGGPRQQKGAAAASVISGMQGSTSAASAALGPLAQSQLKKRGT